MSASADGDMAFNFPPLIRVHRDGRVERLLGTDVVTPSTNPLTGVQSKDIIIDPNMALSARLFIPKITNTSQKLPLLVYFHGGGFCIETAFSPTYHNYADSVAAEAKAIVLSVDYRRAPEHHVPVAFNDSWAAIQWVASHATKGGPEVWLNDYVDYNRIFFAGDSAGANIAQNMAVRVGSEGLDRVKLVGIVLIHPFFGGKEPIGGEIGKVQEKSLGDNLWMFACPSSSGPDDPLFNPVMDPRLSGLGCEKVLVCVAEKDNLRDRGWYYKEELGKSGWGGFVKIMEAEGETHVFHLFNPTCDNAVAMLKEVASFINEDKP